MRDHTSLEAWREAHAVAVSVLALAHNGWRPWAGALFAQLQRSSLSVPLNIAEGYSYGNTRSYTRHLGIAYGSAVETVELLRIGIEAEVFPAEAAILLTRAHRARRLLVGLLKHRRAFPRAQDPTPSSDSSA